MLAACVGVASAADATGNYAIWGAGSASCHQFRRGHEDPALRQSFKDYLMGYLTAYNAVADDTYNALGSLSLEKALQRLDDYCDLHKIDSFDRAVIDMLVALHESRSRKAKGAAPGWGRTRGSEPVDTERSSANP
jgi:hypothetical protein